MYRGKHIRGHAGPKGADQRSKTRVKGERRRNASPRLAPVQKKTPFSPSHPTLLVHDEPYTIVRATGNIPCSPRAHVGPQYLDYCSSRSQTARNGAQVIEYLGCAHLILHILSAPLHTHFLFIYRSYVLVNHTRFTNRNTSLHTCIPLNLWFLYIPLYPPYLSFNLPLFPPAIPFLCPFFIIQQ